MAEEEHTTGDQPIAPTNRGGGLGVVKAAVMSTRPVQWTKAIVVFLPLAFSLDERWTLDDGGLFVELFLNTLAGAAIFAALAGAVYVVNDLFDRERDRNHPRKRHRPIASGAFPAPAAGGLAALLMAAGLTGAYLLDVGFGVVVSVYVVINVGYSGVLKGIALLDVMLVSAGYILRVVAGAQIIDVTVSPWLYFTIGLGALFIALSKRHSELSASGDNAVSQRSTLDRYTREYLSQLIIITAAATLVAYSLYTFEAANVPDNHSLMLTIPFVIFGLFRYLWIVNHTTDAESPEWVIVRDKQLVLGLVLWAVAAVTILAVDRG